MLSSYVPILVMLIAATVIAGGMVIASAALGPKKPTKYKETPYECGMTPVGSARERFPIKFYLIAMLFIIFDIETIFLYPWAVTFRGAGDQAVKLFLLGEMAVFIVILFIGYFYILGKGALDWDDGQAEGQARNRRIFRRRPPIRFGNEGRPVQPGRPREVPNRPTPPSREEEEVRAPAPAG
jgi:NADH-quinone oxidoreductase subunit A